MIVQLRDEDTRSQDEPWQTLVVLFLVALIQERKRTLTNHQIQNGTNLNYQSFVAVVVVLAKSFQWKLVAFVWFLVC